MGIEGAAIASLVAVASNAVITYFYLNKTIPVKFEWKSIISIIVSSALMGIIVRLIHPQSLIALLLSIIAGAIIYTVILLLINKPLKMEIISIIKKLFVNNVPR